MKCNLLIVLCLLVVSIREIKSEKCVFEPGKGAGYTKNHYQKADTRDDCYQICIFKEQNRSPMINGVTYDTNTKDCYCEENVQSVTIDAGNQYISSCFWPFDHCLVNNVKCPTNAHCENVDGAAVCTCDPGHKMQGSQGCQDVNECDENPCHEFATCRNTRGSFQCTCHKGYMGDGFRCQEMWLSNSRCGAAHRLANGMKAQCNHKGNTPCCSDHGFCGLSPKHCECPMCVDYRQGCLYNDMEITGERLRDIPNFSDWRECERLCQKEDECMAWVQTFPRQTSLKTCTLMRDGDKEKLSIRLGVISGLKHCPDDEKRAHMGSMARNETKPRFTTCSYRASCVGNMCTRGAVLKIGDSLRSDNQKYTATMQHDGNFVIYCDDRGITKPIWSSRTDGKRVNEGLLFQRDGNLVLDTISEVYENEAMWSSGTYNSEADHLVMQDNGNLIMYGFHGNRMYWESKSYGMC